MNEANFSHIGPPSALWWPNNVGCDRYVGNWSLNALETKCVHFLGEFLEIVTLLAMLAQF